MALPGPEENALCSESGHASFPVIEEDHLLSKHLEFVFDDVSLVSHRLYDCQGRQEGVLLQLGLAWSRRGRALLGSP